ncbi:MAG: epoxyqueuosine reductase QueH [Bacteroidales bacterium]|nr:epoxyqueuosine reductase QueH [Bacteroidales bacterium]
MAGYSSVFIDSGENYQKQSWRNRCRILTGSGPQDLCVPVVHSSSRAITEIQVEYTTPWVVKFERAVASAYDSSPFFEFYRDEFFAILDSHPATLWELNRQITEWICRKIGVAGGAVEATASDPVRGSAAHPSQPRGWAPRSEGNRGPRKSADFWGAHEGGTPLGGSTSTAPLDLRDAIHPKRPNTILADMGLGRPYWQVFRERFGFTPGLSVLDLLFNEGPDSILWLQRPKKVLLHACCAPCSGAVLERLLQEGYQPVVFWSNSNITPKEEYDHRENELLRYAKKLGVQVVEDDYDHAAWRDCVKGLESEPERGARCLECFKARLLRAAEYASRNGFPILATTLASSRWKSLEQVDEAGSWACSRVEGVQWWPRNWRKGGLQERRAQIIKEQDFYNQTFCGCEFSRTREEL